MADYDSELIGLDFVADILQPIQLVVWGDLAVGYLGVPAVHDVIFSIHSSHNTPADYLQCYMLGIRDDEIELAAEKLTSLGFVRELWSFSSPIDPAIFKTTETSKRIQETIRPAYANFDSKTIRFHYPDMHKQVQKTVLIPDSYMHLSAPQAPSHTSKQGSAIPNPPAQPPFYIHGNLCYPNAVVLLESFIKVCIQERASTTRGMWQARLQTWAIAYLYGELSLRDDVLDSCQDSGVKEFFNLAIQRGSGISRTREKFGRPKPLITNGLIKDF